MALAAGAARAETGLLESHVEPGRDSLGYVSAVEGQPVATAGRFDAAASQPLSGDTVFEIGSVSKVFTALLLADMVARGELALSDTAAQHLPPAARPKPFDGREVTLLDLATYTSGLPRMPANFSSPEPLNPYASYTTAQLFEAVATLEPKYFPGSHYEYANLGFALLGHALARRAGRSYEELVVERICDPLGMGDTRITLSPAMRARFAPAHDTSLMPIPHWDMPAFEAAGALHSTANDLLKFLAARSTPRFAALLETRRQCDIADTVVGLGWFITNRHGDEIVWKDGETGGHASFIGYSPRSGRAAVLLSNANSDTTTLPLGWHLVNPAFPPPKLRASIAVARLERFAGRYPLTPKFALTVTPRDGHLMVQASGQAEYEVFAESETRFFYRVVDAQLTFEIGADGMASAVTLHQNGRDLRGRREN